MAAGADALLALLADLSDSPSALLRVGVVEGLAALATSLSDRWSRTRDSGGGSAAAAFATRQHAAVEDIMWRVLLAGRAGGEDTEAADLAAAAAAEAPPAMPVSYALCGSAAGTEAAASERVAAARGAMAASAALHAPLPPLPPSWSAVPPSVADAIASTLMPAMLLWAHRLGVLWTTTLPSVLALLAETLAAPAPSDATKAGAVHVAPAGTVVAAGGPGAPVRPASTAKLTDWHATRVRLILHVLSASAPRIRDCMFEESCTITPAEGAPVPAPPAPVDAPPADADGTAAAPTPAAAVAVNLATDFIYEFFDFSSSAAVSNFPPELPLTASVKNGVVVLGAGAGAGGAAAGASGAGSSAARNTAALAALLLGTAAVRRRRNAPVNVGALSPGQAVWAPVRDEHIVLAWPALRYVTRSLVCVLLAQAASVSRGSAAGRAVAEAYAHALGTFGGALGGAFVSGVLRPVLSRTLGFAVDLPAHASAPVSTTPPVGGRAPSLTLLSQVLFGVPANPADARRAAVAAAAGAFAGAPLNFASAGPRGLDWPFVVPELGWCARDDAANPSNTATPAAVRAHAERVAAAAAAPPPPAPTAPGVPADVAAKLGGAWNAEWAVPVVAHAVLGAPSLPARAREAIFRALVTAVSTAKGGWGAHHQALLEEAAVAAARVPAAASPAVSIAGTSMAVVSAAAPSAAATSTAAATAASPALPILLDVLAKLAHESDNATKLSVLGALRALVPSIPSTLLESPFLPAVRALARDQNAGVVRAAVRALAAVYASGPADSATAREAVNEEVTALLARGPKDVRLKEWGRRAAHTTIDN